MISLRTGLFTAAAVVLGSGLTIAATQGSGHAATAAPAAPPPVVGGATLHTTSVDLPPSAWVTTPLTVHLPHAGTYELDANVRGRLSGNYPLNTYIVARLWDDNTAAPVPYSQRLVYQIIDNDTSSGAVGGNNTAPISEWVTVHGPTTIHLQAQDNNAVGTASIAQIYSDINGYTTLRWVRVS
jgi:hypothetical protein